MLTDFRSFPRKRGSHVCLPPDWHHEGVATAHLTRTKRTLTMANQRPRGKIRADDHPGPLVSQREPAESAKAPVVALFCPVDSERIFALDRFHGAGCVTWSTDDAARFMDLLSSGHARIATIHCTGAGQSAGLELVRRVAALGRNRDLRILAIHDEGSPTARALALDAGADLPIGSVLDPTELGAIVRHLTRDSPALEAVAPRQDDPRTPWRIDSARRLLFAPDGTEVRLSALEYTLLDFLMRSSNQVVTRRDLLTAVYPEHAATRDFHRVDLLVARLRRKAFEAGMPLPLRTVFGKGFVFVNGHR